VSGGQCGYITKLKEKNLDHHSGYIKTYLKQGIVTYANICCRSQGVGEGWWAGSYA
jgi:hypothetical protein